MTSTQASVPIRSRRPVEPVTSATTTLASRRSPSRGSGLASLTNLVFKFLRNPKMDPVLSLLPYLLGAGGNKPICLFQNIAIRSICLRLLFPSINLYPYNRNLYIHLSKFRYQYLDIQCQYFDCNILGTLLLPILFLFDFYKRTYLQSSIACCLLK